LRIAGFSDPVLVEKKILLDHLLSIIIVYFSFTVDIEWTQQFSCGITHKGLVVSAPWGTTEKNFAETKTIVKYLIQHIAPSIVST
jgi:hypothetical protein